MTRRKQPCFAATEDALVASGLQPDRYGLKQALWEAAEGVVFAQGRVVRKRTPGLAFATSGHPIRGIGQQHASDGGRWLWAGESHHIWRWQFGDPELIDGAYGSYRGDQAGALLPTFYDFTPYGNWMIVNDGVAPFIYKPEAGTPWAAWAGEVPQGAVRYMKVLNFIMALGYDLRGTRVGWSDADNIDTWTAAADNLAGSLTIDEFNTPIRAGERLGSYVACYSENQLGLVSYIGAPNIFGQKLSLEGIGAVGKAAVASDLKQNVGVSRNGVWWTDGNSYEYIDRGFLGKHLQDEVNWDQAGKIIACKNAATDCFEFHFPVGVGVTSNNEGWCWDPKSNGWSPTPPVSLKAPRSLFNYPILGDGDGNVSFDDFDFSAGDNFPLVLRTRPLTLNEPDGTTRGTHVVSYVDELELMLLEALNVEVRVGCSDDPNGDWEWTAWAEVAAGSRILPLERLPENPLWKVEFRSVPGSADWRLNLQGLLLYGPATGTKLEE